MSLRVVEIFSGFGGFSEAFLEAGDLVVRVDNDPRFATVPSTVIADVRTWSEPERIDVLLAGPPCNAFSVASIGRHYARDGTPDAAALLGRELVAAALRMIRRHPESTWLLENPRGMLRRWLGRPRETVYYCSYGLTSQKPTDLWGNYPEPLRLPCGPHISAPRGSKQTGTIQGMSGAANRARVPIRLSRRIRQSIVSARTRQGVLW